MVEGVEASRPFLGRRWTPGRRLRNNGALELLIVFKFLSKVSDSEREVTILYAVARGTVVLAVFSAVTGNTGAVARWIVEKLPAEADSKLCFSQDSNIGCLITAGAGSTYLFEQLSRYLFEQEGYV